MRKRFTKIAFSAAFVLAMALTFGCSSGDDNSPGGTTGGSPGVGGEIVYGPDVPYEGGPYKTVVIGTQTWFQRNLNYAVTGSKCGVGGTGTTGSLSDANTATCDTYGRLYDWATAMALDASCNGSTCASQITTPHQGICPSGWHIPSDEDWNVLMKFVNPSCSDNSDCAGAGTKLKAREGWEPYSDSGVPAGTDDYGFSALPGGSGSSRGSFYDVGHIGSWWSASELSSYNAYDRYMGYYNETAGWDGDNKYDLFSVRCVKD